MRRRTVGALLATSMGMAALSGGAGAPASAGPAGDWTKISTGTVSTQNTITLVRGVDGVLHGLYGREASGGTDELVALRLDIDGFVMNETSFFGGIDTLNEYPVLTKTSTGVRAHYGVFVGGPPNPYSGGGVHYAEAADVPGTAWASVTTPVLAHAQGYASDGTGAVALSDDTPVTAITRGSEIAYSAGFGQPLSSFDQGACCAYYATVVTNGVDAAVAWQGNGGTAGTTGVFARQIHPGLGATTFKGPKSSVGTGGSHAISMSDQPTAAVQRNDGYTWIAYPVGYPTRTSVALWRAGDTSAKYLTAGKGARLVALATGPSGRMWLAWAPDNTTIKLARTAASGATVGAVRTVRKPAAATGIHQIALEATYGEVDLVINGGNGFYHTQVKPGLSFSASPKSWRPRTATTVRFTVKDAGVAVKGARVAAKGKTCKTGASGTCAIRFPALKRSSVEATATKGTAYAPATLTLKVR